jgi:transposase-like protein
MNDLPYLCPTCKTIYEIIRHRVRPAADPVCETCQQDFPVAENGDWLTYRLIPLDFKRTG